MPHEDAAGGTLSPSCDNNHSLSVTCILTKTTGYVEGTQMNGWATVRIQKIPTFLMAEAVPRTKRDLLATVGYLTSFTIQKSGGTRAN